MEQTGLYEMADLQVLGFEELRGLAEQLREAEDSSRWQLGDIAEVVNVKFGSIAVSQLATEINKDRDTLQRYRAVAKAFDKEVREKYKKLSWSHFKVASPQDNPEMWLELAHDNNWSVEELRVRIKQNKLNPDDDYVAPPDLDLDQQHVEAMLMNAEGDIMAKQTIKTDWKEPLKTLTFPVDTIELKNLLIEKPPKKRVLKVVFETSF